MLYYQNSGIKNKERRIPPYTLGRRGCLQAGVFVVWAVTITMVIWLLCNNPMKVFWWLVLLWVKKYQILNIVITLKRAMLTYYLQGCYCKVLVSKYIKTPEVVKSDPQSAVYWPVTHSQQWICFQRWYHDFVHFACFNLNILIES